jgi:chemotaxis protein MotB
MNDKRDKDQKEQEEDVYAPMFGLYFKRSRSEGGEDESIPLWLITFADIMALMLTFFVMMYTMSTPETEKWEEFSSSLNQGFSKFYGKPMSAGPQDTINIDKMDVSRALDLKYLRTLLAEIIAKDERLKGAVLILQKDRLILSLPQEILFESGKSEVQPRGQQALYEVADLLNRLRNRVEVIGHTDPRPIEKSPEGLSSNWELSLARATNVASGLEAAGYSRNMVVRGLSSARYAELPSDLPEEERLGYARRVDIVIMTDDGGYRRLLTLGSG